MGYDYRTVHELPEKRIGFAGSGGLDSCTIVHWLAQQGYEVVCLTANLGQPDEENIEDIERRMRACGAVDFHLIPLEEELAEAGLRQIHALACYEGGYWNTTGIARHVISRGVVKKMPELGLSVLAHGSTGRGNDQVRFQLISHMLAPDIHLYAPWRDEAWLNQFKGRAEMIDYCHAHSLPIRASKDAPYSTDANLLGLTHEAGKLESLSCAAQFISPGMGVFPKDAPDSAEEFEIRFEHGQPVAINGESVGVLDAFHKANRIAGRNGYGIGVHVVENRIVGMKSRGVYEQPGIQLIGACYEYLAQLVLDRPARTMLDSLSTIVAENVYYGRGFDTATQMAFGAVEKTLDNMTGTIRVSLYRGNLSFVAAQEVPHLLYSEEATSMEAVGDFDHQDSEGFLRVQGLGARALARAGQIRHRGAC